MCSKLVETSQVEPLFVGSHPAIDFLNTRFFPHGKPVEVLGDGDFFLEWMVQAGLLTESATVRVKRRLGVQRLDALAADSRALREWASHWISRWSLAPMEDYGLEIGRLNGLLRKGRYHREVTSTAGRWELLDHSNADSADDLLALIAMQIALLVTVEDPALLRRCAGKECTLWFLDRTKGHRRMFCSTSACGNRAKVAAFRARQKDA